MRISVITPTFNRPDFLKETIKSFLAQNYEDKEMIIVNDGGSEEHAVYVPKDPRVKYFWKPHTNQADTQNYGIEKATGDLICTLDDDDLFYDDNSLTVRAEKFADDSIDAIWTNGIDFFPQGYGSNEFSTGEQILARDNIYINSIMFRKSIKDKLGGYYFDDRLTSNEDWDFKIRMIMDCNSKGFDILTVKHRIHGGMRSTLHRNSGELDKNTALINEKIKDKYK